MRRFAIAFAVLGVLLLTAVPALAGEQTTARDIEAAVDSYLASAQRDASLVGGQGSAGYDSGFWIRGGDFTLRINMTLQARYEYYKFDTAEQVQRVIPGGPQEVGPDQGALLQDFDWPGGDLSGFSLPRAILKFSGTAPCNIRYYVEMDFGHSGGTVYGLPYAAAYPWMTAVNPGAFATQSGQFSNTREAWIEWGMSDTFNFRMGQILYPNARQLMVAPELQQFVDISMASSMTGLYQPGYTDRNRDHGAMIHGVFGCNSEWQYMLAVTNGDGGDSIRNVINPLTSDNLMISGRINWAFLEPIGYTEGATRRKSCTWYGEFGVWGSYYADRMDMPHTSMGDRMMIGADLALGYGGFSFTAGFTYFDFKNADTTALDWIGVANTGVQDEQAYMFLVQAGYLFPDTGWEIAARYSYYQRTIEADGVQYVADQEPDTSEIAGVINYYLNGHGNKLQLDFTYISATADGFAGGGYFDAYPGVPLGFGSDGDSFLIRFQWQLAL